MYVLVINTCNKNPISVLVSGFDLEKVENKMNEFYPEEKEELTEYPSIEVDGRYNPTPPELSEDFGYIVKSFKLNNFTQKMANDVEHYGCLHGIAYLSIYNCSKLYCEEDGVFDWSTFTKRIHQYYKK